MSKEKSQKDFKQKGREDKIYGDVENRMSSPWLSTLGKYGIGGSHVHS